MTWIDVVDSAVKIGLGALIAAFSSFLLAKKNHDRDAEKERRRRSNELLELVAEHVERFTSASLVYWVWVGDAIRAKNGLKRNSPDTEKVKAAQRELFDAFQEMTSAEAKLLLLGHKSAQEKLRLYGDVAGEMRKRFSSSPEEVGEDEIYEWRAKMLNARAAFFDELSAIYKK